jgi:SAM-dependent methyltransferase
MTDTATTRPSRWFLLRGLVRQFVTRPRATVQKLENLVAAVFDVDSRRRQGSTEFEAEYQAFREMLMQSDRTLPMRRDEALPCMDDRLAKTPFDAHYTYHPAWAARVVARVRPQKHVDISSSLSFGTIVSAFVPVDFYDLRPAPLELSNFGSARADLSRLELGDGSVSSLSCMHVIEHIGLGRYGDRLDPNGDLGAIRELIRVLAPGGNLLVVVPVGRQRIEFNAHRVYDFGEFRGYFAELELIEFALLPDGETPAGLVVDPPRHLVDAQEYGCGCFWFRKPTTPNE